MQNKNQEELDNYFTTIRLKNEPQTSKAGAASKKRKGKAQH